MQLMAYVKGTEFGGTSTVLARIRVSQRLLRWRAEARGLLRMSAVGAGGACDLTNRRSRQPPPILARPARWPYLSSNQRLLRISSGLMYCRRGRANIDHSIAHSHA